MTERETILKGLAQIANYFRERSTDASASSQTRFWRFAEISRRAMNMVYSDGETLKEYEKHFEREEDDGK